MEDVPVAAAGVVQKVLAVSKFSDTTLHLEILRNKAEPTLRLRLEADDTPAFHVRVERSVDGVEFTAKTVEIEVVVEKGCEA